MANLIKKTSSICPECYKVIAADLVEKDNKVWMEKECPEHGKFEELYWGDYEYYKRAEKFHGEGRGLENPFNDKDTPNCPYDCGLCKAHKSHTNLANMVITNRCNLACWYCFYYADKMGFIYEPTMDQVHTMCKSLRGEKPIACNAIQLTGGEPTIRDDLIDIVKTVKSYGFDHVQLNTNGIKIAKDLEYTQNLKNAGINVLYLSFDGVTPKTNPKNHWEVPGVIENCRKTGIRVVFVPTVIKSVNEHEVGDIVNYALNNIGTVRSVNFQPVSLVGQMQKKEREKFRITIPDVIDCLSEQTNGMVEKSDFYPIPITLAMSHFAEAFTGNLKYELTSHYACGAGTYLFKGEKGVVPVTRFIDAEGFIELLDELTQELNQGKNRVLIGGKLLKGVNKLVDKEKMPKEMKISKIITDALTNGSYSALAKFHENALFVGMMHFMDPYNYDIERVKNCTIHYTNPDGSIIPFCTFNVLPHLYRDDAQKKYSMTFDEWEKKTGKKLSDDVYRRVVEDAPAHVEM